MVKIIRLIAMEVRPCVGLQMFSMEGNSTVERDTTVIWRLLPHLRRLHHLRNHRHHLFYPVWVRECYQKPRKITDVCLWKRN